LGSKISKLAEAARERGYAAESVDYLDLPDTGPRVERLLQSKARAARFLHPRLSGEKPVPNAKSVNVIHGWSDEVLPVEHSIQSAGEFQGVARRRP
jgi:hypothetical protein